MSLIGSFWQKICVPLDGFLWHRDISHPVIRQLLRNQILAGGAAIIAGGALFAVFPWLFWFGCGLLCMMWIFWSWARFFLRMDPESYRLAFMRAFFFNFILRFFVLAVLLYFALAVFHASISGLLCGIVAGSIIAIITYALNLKT